MKNLIILITLCLLLPSCATLLGGSRDSTRVKDGVPSGARVYVNGNYAGNAPTSVKIPKTIRNGEGSIEIKADGYKTQTVKLTRKVSVGFVILDVFTGVFPLAIDFATGNIYKPRPNKIEYYLEPEGSVSKNDSDFKIGQKVIFTSGKIKNQKGKIIALYPNKALIEYTRPATLYEKKVKKVEEVTEQIEVPFANVAKIK